MKSILSKNKYFLIPYLIFLMSGIPILFFSNKGEFLKILNGTNTQYLDIMFKYATHLGDFLFVIFVVVILLFIKVRHSIFLIMATASAGISAQIIKRIAGLPRPKGFFEDLSGLHFIDGVKVHSHFSFPSGHSATAFALFLALSFLVKNNYLKFFFFLMALTVGLSRVYILQHFFVDIYFGSILGIVFTLFAYYWLTVKSKLDSKEWFNNPIIRRK